MYRFLSILVLAVMAITAVFADTDRSLADEFRSKWKGRVVYCTNSGRVLTFAEMQRVPAAHVKSADVYQDTVKVTLRGGGDLMDLTKQLRPAYKATMTINGGKCVFEKMEIPEQFPKTSQYMLCDTCFYFTFDLSPQFQTKGVKTWMSGVIVSCEAPAPGKRYEFKAPDLDKDIPIAGWVTECGDIATLQMAMLPESGELFPKDSIPAELRGKRVILKSAFVTDGYIEITSFKTVKPGLAEIDVVMNFTAALKGGVNDEIVQTVEVKDCKVDFQQVQRTQLKPMLFEIDYEWGNKTVPAKLLK